MRAQLRCCMQSVLASSSPVAATTLTLTSVPVFSRTARWPSDRQRPLRAVQPRWPSPSLHPFIRRLSPAIYNYKQSAHVVDYVDIDSYSAYSFGYGLSYSTFSRFGFSASSSRADLATAFTANDTITFRLTVQNAGPLPGSDVPQIYLLSRVSSVVQPLRQLVAFKRVYLDVGEEREDEMTLDPSRLLITYTRSKTWEVERGEYTFALTTSDRGGDVGVNATLTAL